MQLLNQARPSWPQTITEEEVALLRVGLWLRRFGWDGFLLGWTSAFHLTVAIVLASFPWPQLLTEGTRPVLELASRYVWAVAFALVGIAVAFLEQQHHAWLRLGTWVAVLFLGGVWLTAFSAAITRGEGSALGIVAWAFLYAPMGIVAVRLGLRKR